MASAALVPHNATLNSNCVALMLLSGHQKLGQLAREAA